ncbi:MAG: hypothetical protein RL757_1203 [Bacteroidota bacterium]|jgi:nucleoside-diphosphate-sugar epimerase
MKKIIVVAGGTGNLGGQIINALLEQGAEVRAIVRNESDVDKIKKIKSLGVTIFSVDMENVAELTSACRGAHCVVSALSGLGDVILETQKILLDAAVAAGVKRFIPSDYSLDFIKFSDGENRNLDWRRKFHSYLDQQPIAATSIFNGAFMDMLLQEFPMLFFKPKRLLYWGDADHLLGFTTVADTARYTAHVALDDESPRYLRIAGSQISPRGIRKIVEAQTGSAWSFWRTGGAGRLGRIIKITRFFSPSTTELYPAWQGMQYMHNMIDVRARINHLDNDRYPSIRWTTVEELLKNHQQN